ncbi:MAG: hypothetical protein IJ943_07335 [Akkermansia sp.]|nr:hypothetical protein [Akkermansia sp.]
MCPTIKPNVAPVNGVSLQLTQYELIVVLCRIRESRRFSLLFLTVRADGHLTAEGEAPRAIRPPGFVFRLLLTQLLFAGGTDGMMILPAYNYYTPLFISFFGF